MTTKELDQNYIAHTYARADVVFTKGKGSVLEDEAGKTYIDLGTGIAVNGHGIANDAWINAVTAQLQALPHASNLYYTCPQAKLAQMLCERTGMKRVFFGNSGAEANEAAIKAARKYSSDKYGDNRGTVICLKNSFHGRTITTLSATGQDVFHQHFHPFTPGFVFGEANNFDSIAALAQDESVCAVMMELVQGEGGVLVLEKEFVQKVAALCAEKDLILIIDEVQTGNGRTGFLYAFEQYGIMPDVVSTAKGLGGGLPFGACMLGEKVQDTFGPSSHGSTFGGNPVCAAGAIALLEQTDDALLKGVQERHDYIVNALKDAPGVKSVSGLGLMLGIETVRPAKEIVADCMAKGVVVLTAKTKVRLLPALNIPMEQLEQAIDVLKSVLA